MWQLVDHISLGHRAIDRRLDARAKKLLSDVYSSLERDVELMPGLYLLLNSSSTALAITLLAGKGNLIGWIFLRYNQPGWRAMGVAPIWRDTSGKACDGGVVCHPTKDCCPTGCCPAAPRPNPPFHVPPTFIDFVVWNGGFFWCLLFLLVVFCMGGCGLWCRGKSIFGRRCCRERRQDEDRSERDSAGSCCAPPHYSACSTMHRPPPPYTEVTSKPDLYPLVITYAGENGKAGGNYLMVQYFRNFIVQPPLGTISAGSTVDSISSSFLCQSGTEADSNVPPPYEEPEARRTLPTSLSGLSVASATGDSSEPNCASRRELCRISSYPVPDSPTATAHYRPCNIRLTTFSRANRSVLPENRKHYPPEVILQQPQRYCELHYLSTDILGERHGSISSEDLSHPRGSLQDFVSSDGLSRSGHQFSTSSDVSSLIGANTPDSPPQATSPTGELKDLLDKIHQLPRTRLSHYSQTECADDADEENSLLLGEGTSQSASATRPSKLQMKRKAPVKSKTFHLPFITRNWPRVNHSVSAPTTPLAGGSSPSLLTNPLRSSSRRSSSRSKEDSNPLLAEDLDNEEANGDEVF